MKRTYVLLLSAVAVALIAAACSSDDDEPDVASDSGSDTSEVVAEDTGSEEPASGGEETSAGEETAGDSSALPTLGEISLTWSTEEIGAGIKPAFAIDSNDVVHIGLITEEIEGGSVYYANNASGSFETEEVAEGYFYAPIDVAVNAAGEPYFAWHDHQDVTFLPNKGDEVVAVRRDGVWDVNAVSDTGHDGWDNSIVVDADGNWHTASVDPAQFNSDSGVEYASNAGGSVNVTQIGSGAINYEFGTSIALTPDGTPGITYYNNSFGDLHYASLEGGSWTDVIVDEESDTGRYSSLAYDSAGNPHISYYERITDTTGIVRHAWWDGSGWQTESVDMLDDVVMGFIGARKITSLLIDGDDNVHLAYTDQSRIVYAQRDADGNWSAQDAIVASGTPFGQLVELALDSAGNPSLLWFQDVGGENTVMYASAS